MWLLTSTSVVVRAVKSSGNEGARKPRPNEARARMPRVGCQRSAAFGFQLVPKSLYRSRRTASCASSPRSKGTSSSANAASTSRGAALRRVVAVACHGLGDRRLDVVEGLVPPLAADRDGERSGRQLEQRLAGVAVDRPRDAGGAAQRAAHLGGGEQGVAGRPGRAERVDQAAVERALDGDRIDIPAHQAVRRVAGRDRDRRVVVPAGEVAPEADQCAPVVGAGIAGARPERDGPVAHVMEVARETEALRVVRARRRHVDLDHAVRGDAVDGCRRDPVARAVRFVEGLGEGLVIGGEPQRASGQHAGLRERREIVGLARVVVVAATVPEHGRAVAGRCGRIGVAADDRDVGRKVARRRAVQAELRHVGGRRERAVARRQLAVLQVIDDGEDVVAVGGHVADAAAERAARLRAAAAFAVARRGRRHDAAKIPAHHDVDDAGDRVAAVDRRGAVLQDLDPLDGGQRDRVQVDADLLGAEGVVGQAAAVQQDQRRRRAEAAQRCAREAGLGVVADVERIGPGIDTGRHPGDQLLRRLHAAALDLLAADDLHRQRCLGVDAADARTDDLDLVQHRGLAVGDGRAAPGERDGRDPGPACRCAPHVTSA